MGKSGIIVKKNLKINMWKRKNIVDIEFIVNIKEKYRAAAYSICNLKYNVPKKIPIVFHNGSSYDDNFCIKELPEEFKKQFACLGENTKK